MKAELQQLVALQTLDTSIRRLKRDLEAIPERRAEIEKAVSYTHLTLPTIYSV